LLDWIEDADARAECLAEARLQIDRMSRLVSDLLLLAQVEAGLVIERRPVALHELVERIAHEAHQRADGRIVSLERLEPIEVTGDEIRLAQVLANLVDNALKHTPPGGLVSLGMGRENGGARLTVTDTGEGIAAEELPHVFDRFFRSSRARSPSQNGAGLGLAIVKHLTEAHGGQVGVESQQGRGSRFTVWLPLTTGDATSKPKTAA
jgi:signal transduction histidine kinase